jgi:hypothetical protein
MMISVAFASYTGRSRFWSDKPESGVRHTVGIEKPFQWKWFLDYKYLSFSILTRFPIFLQDYPCPSVMVGEGLSRRGSKTPVK